MKRVRVNLGPRSYEVVIGEGVARSALGALVRREKKPRKVFLIADRKLRAEALKIQRYLKTRGWPCVVETVRADEGFKDLKTLYPFYGKMLKAGLDRKSFLFALGGGVIGDAAGFLAASYLRGIRWVGLPTTLLAQVDSSIGGKTAVNHAAGKNLIGAFHQPTLVICDTRYLRTLPRREMISGLGEIVKYGLIQDRAFFSWLEKNWKAIAGGKSARALERAVFRSAQLKARAVASDELDVRGIRETLNFGHTIGHALEGATRYGAFRHGEAILHGMKAASELSWLRGHLDGAANDRIQALLEEIPVPRVPKGVRTESLLPYIKRDKKAEAGKVRFVILKAIGKAGSDPEVSDRELRAVCDGLLSGA